MYEIWLGLNIIYEILRPALGWLLVVALLWLALLFAVVRSSRADWRKALPATLILGAFAAVATFVLGPVFTASSLSELRYWVDWAFLGGSALAAGTGAALAAWPLLAWLARRS